jgi:hypothetical protein
VLSHEDILRIIFSKNKGTSKQFWSEISMLPSLDLGC